MPIFSYITEFMLLSFGLFILEFINPLSWTCVFYVNAMNIFNCIFLIIFSYLVGKRSTTEMGSFKVCWQIQSCWFSLYLCVVTSLSCLGQGVDTVLSETGIQQCEAVGRYLRETRFNNIFVSDLQRAVQVRQKDTHKGVFNSPRTCYTLRSLV